MASSNTPKNSIPEGWWLSEQVPDDGIKIKRYTNVLGQQFYTMKDLMRYVKYAKKAKVSIYSPGFTVDKEDEEADIKQEKKELVPVKGKRQAANKSSNSSLNLAPAQGSSNEVPVKDSLPSRKSRRLAGLKPEDTQEAPIGVTESNSIRQSSRRKAGE